MQTIYVRTEEARSFIEITARIQDAAGEFGWKDGVLYIFIPHTTAGVTINENADPNVMYDMGAYLKLLIPSDQPYYRHAEGNSAAHFAASLVGASESVFVENAKLVLGTWQGVYLCEFDGPRNRRVLLKFLKA